MKRKGRKNQLRRSVDCGESVVKMDGICFVRYSFCALRLLPLEVSLQRLLAFALSRFDVLHCPYDKLQPITRIGNYF